MLLDEDQGSDDDNGDGYYLPSATKSINTKQSVPAV